MEAPDPPFTVEPFLPAISSRPVPVFGYGAGVFRIENSGKYADISSFPFPDPAFVSSRFTATVFHYQTPGRTCNDSHMEALNPLITVEPLLPATSSRPGPVFENGERVFQNSHSGKFAEILYPPHPDSAVTFSHLGSTSRTFSVCRSPGRIYIDNNLEVPDPLITVEPLQPATCSRPGPVYENGEGVFRNGISGKYDDISSLPFSDSAFACSHLPIGRSYPHHQTPGRTLKDGTMEALDPLITVEPLQPTTSSRPGPVYENGEGVFRTLTAGKCNQSSTHFLPECASNSSTAIASSTVRQTARELRIYYQNVRGLRTKIDAFFLAVTDSEYDVIVLTETWLDPCILSTQLFGDAYTVFRTDRNPVNSRKLRGGGVLIAVSSKLCCCAEPAPVSKALEQIWVRIKLEMCSVSIGVVYLPPDRKDDLSLIRVHSDSLSSVLSCLNTQDIALQFGDYNHPNIDWIASDDGGLSVDSSLSRFSASDSALYDAFCFNGLTQINTVKNNRSRTLDLVLANEVVLPNCIIAEAIDPFVEIDLAHPAIDVAVTVALPVRFEQPYEAPRFDFHRADYDLLNQVLSTIDWQFLDGDQDLDEIVESFNSEIRRVIEAHVPLQRPSLKPPWSNSRLRRLKRLRNRARRRYNRNRSPCMKRQFVLASNEYKRCNRSLYARHIDRTQKNLRLHPKRFWSFVRTKRKENGLPSSMYLNARLASTDGQKCDLFADHFKSAFSDRPISRSHMEAASLNTPLDSFDYGIFEITDEQVLNAVRKLKHSVSYGPDGIPACMLKKCSTSLLTPLVKLFNKSLQRSIFPSSWKSSVMTPIHKKGDKCDIANYRGITSLSACSKVFEIIMNDTLFEASKNYISTAQHGFFPKRSVNTNLTQFTSLCIRSMDAGLQVDAIYTDFKAAFDRVNHDLLLHKLEKLGVSVALVNWFKSYLTNRSMKVKIGSSHSSLIPVTSGVPQGSNLGPLLFSLFINDVAFILPPGTRIFYADDVKIFMVITCMDDCVYLQKLLDSFEDWSNRNLLELCVAKCNTISFARKRHPIHFQYRLAGHVLERMDHVRDLGVILDSELNFRIHYNDVISKANRQLGFIFKLAVGFDDPLCLKSLYCALVRSILESAVLVWCPYTSVWVDRIEAIQRKFVRLALRNLPWRDRFNLPPYEHRCMLLGIETLEKRRSTQQAVFIAKVLTNEIDAPDILADISFYVPERSLRRRNFLYLESRNSRYGQHDPIRFMASRFNEISELFDFHAPVAALRNRLRNR